ncbi:MAG: DinB family protein [Anaerolineae bacterium]
MLETSLYRAVGQFAAVTQGVADPELDREWAWGAYDSEGVRFAFFRTYEDLRDLAARMAAERSTGGPAVSSAQRILAQYHSAYRDLEAALLSNGPDESEPALIGAAQATQAPAEGEWPVRQVVAHITSAELGFYGVVKYALERHRSGDGRPAEIPDEAWDDLVGETEESFHALMEESLDSLRAYHAALHQRVLYEFASIGDEELALPSMYWEGAELSLRFRLHRFDSHLRQHTVQVDKTLVKIGQPPNEAKRLLRLIYGALAEAEGAMVGAWDTGAALRDEVAGAISARADEIAGILA